MNAQDLINLWESGADDAWKTAEILFKNKKYNHSLFFCHLALEKLLKGLIVERTGNHALPIHNLEKLAGDAGLKFNQEQITDLKEITSWNLEARYENIKQEFYKKATKEFTALWFVKAKEYFLWLKKQY